MRVTIAQCGCIGLKAVGVGCLFVSFWLRMAFCFACWVGLLFVFSCIALVLRVYPYPF